MRDFVTSRNDHLKNIGFLNYVDFQNLQWKTPLYPYERMRKKAFKVSGLLGK